TRRAVHELGDEPPVAIVELTAPELATDGEVGVRPVVDALQRLQRHATRVHVPRRSPLRQCAPLAHAWADMRPFPSGCTSINSMGSVPVVARTPSFAGN